MEITVRVVSCLLGTCFVIDYVPVKSEVLISERKKDEKKFWHRKLSPGFFFFFYSYNDANILLHNPMPLTHCPYQSSYLCKWMLPKSTYVLMDLNG